MKRIGLSALLLLLSFLPAQAEMPIEVEASVNDPVGRQLVFEVKEQLRISPSFTFLYDRSVVRMQAHIATLANERPMDSEPGTVFSVAVTWNNPAQPYPFFLTQYAGRCTRAHIPDCARDVVARISDESDKMIRLLVENAER